MSEPETSGASPDQDFVRVVWEEARDLIKRLEGTTVQRFSVEAGGTRIEIERRPGTVVAPLASAATAAASSGDGAAEAAAAAADGRAKVIAPLVGTFYRSPSPGAKMFVEEGDVVDAGQTVAIVEAMKLMNQVSADQGGRVAEVLVKDGDWVEFEQVLMYLEPIGD
jgi:acetyl-CoA carboxylase biotin carboxyl carrier protein